MEIGLGHLRMAPAVFWGYSVKEWIAAWDGYRESVGAEEAPEPFTQSELQALMEEYPDDDRHAP